MTSPIEPRTASLYHASRDAAVPATAGGAITVAAIAAYLLLPALVPAGGAFLVAQAALLAVPVGWLVATRRPRPFAALGLRGARPRYFFAGAAVGATAWYVSAVIVARLPLPDEHARVLEALVEHPPLARALLGFAVVPAVCEEVLFRGVLARSLATSTGVLVAAALSGAIFSLYHVSIVQALPTLVLGVVLAVIAIRAGSVAPTILAHVLNNAIVILLSRHAWPALNAWIALHPVACLVGCVIATAIGLVVAARGAA
ncbi:MAG TPA: type II CAAX endopeptidase family protein [Kofleriaceae bacterium]